MAVPVPNNVFEVTEGIVAYVNFFKGKIRINIQKTYFDKATNTLALGKGLCIEEEQWSDLETQWEDISEYIEGQLKK